VSAMSKALSTSSLNRCERMAQPTTLRLNTSSTTARYKKRNRPVSPVLTGRYELCGKPDCGLGRSDIPGQKLFYAIDGMLGDAL